MTSALLKYIQKYWYFCVTTMFSFILILLFLLYFLIVIKSRRSREYRLISKFPSLGVEFPIIGSVWKFVGGPTAFMKAVDYYAKVITEYGGVGRFYFLTVYYIIITDAIDATMALKFCLDKDFLYQLLRTFTGDGTAFSSSPAAMKRRKVLIPAFRPRSLYSFIDVFWEESVILTDVLGAHAGAGPFSVEDYLHRYNLRTILRAGIDISDGEVYCEEFHDALNSWEVLAKRRLTNLLLYPDFLYRLTSQYRQGQHIVSTFHHYGQKIMDQRIEEIKSHNRSQTAMGQGTSRGPVEGIFDAIINSDLDDRSKLEEVLVLVMATDLVTLSLGFTLLLLGLYPEIQHRVYSELREVFEGSDRPITKEDIGRLSYLEMVIKEALRLYPPVPLIGRRVLKDLELPSGNIVPAGTSVAVAITGVHRNPRYWGEDADRFDPERFSPERFQKVPAAAFMPFSFGPRNCVGYKFGIISMKVLVSTILRKYRIVGEPAAGPIPPIQTKLLIFQRAENDYEIEIVRRD